MSRLRYARRQRGVTLAEMLVTVAVLALAASIAVSSAAPVSSFASEAVAGEVARALSFARNEAIRTNAWRVVRIDPADQSLSVYRPGSESSVVGAQAVHPVDKSPYRIVLDDAGGRGRLAIAEFTYDDNTVRNYIGFGPDGAPAVQDASRIRLLKSDGKIVIRHAHVERQIVVQTVTGRVVP